MAEQLLDRRLSARGLAARVTSAGLLSGGQPTPATGIRVAAMDGLDLARHRSRQVNNNLIATSDLILTMTRAHAREIVALYPDAWSRTFPLKQFGRMVRGTSVPRRALFSDAAMLVGLGRNRKSILGDPATDTVIDPMGQNAAVWQQVVTDLAGHIDEFVDVFATNFPESAS